MTFSQGQRPVAQSISIYMKHFSGRALRRPTAALEATQGQMNGFCSQFLYKCLLGEVVSVGDRLKI